MISISWLGLARYDVLPDLFLLRLPKCTNSCVSRAGWHGAESRFFCARPYKPASWLALPVPPGSKSEPASLASLLTLKFKKKKKTSTSHCTSNVQSHKKVSKLFKNHQPPNFINEVRTSSFRGSGPGGLLFSFCQQPSPQLPDPCWFVTCLLRSTGDRKR